jgi:hypothetical protein
MVLLKLALRSEALAKAPMAPKAPTARTRRGAQGDGVFCGASCCERTDPSRRDVLASELRLAKAPAPAPRLLWAS